MNFRKKPDSFCIVVGFFMLILLILLLSIYPNTNVKEDDIFEYAETYLKTYKEIIENSELNDADIGTHSFYHDYPYSVKATISTSHGAAVAFVSNNTSENLASMVPYSIEKLIHKLSEKEKKNLRIGFTISGKGITFQNVNTRGSFIYIEKAEGINLYQLNDITPVLLAEGIDFNGFTYIDTANIAREGNITINGTLVLDKKVVIKGSNLKTDWTKEQAINDSIDLIYTEKINGIYGYSQLTGIGQHEIELLVRNYKDRESIGYYIENENDKWSDRQDIFNKADEYGISHGSVIVELSGTTDEKTFYGRVFGWVEDILTIYTLGGLIIGVYGWSKRENLSSQIKKLLRYTE